MTRQAAANTSRSQTKSTAILLKVAQSMSQLGIAALPRNYELVYEALSGRLPQLSRDLAALGATPKQDALDELGLKHHLIAHGALAADRARATAQEELNDLALQLRHSLAQRHAFRSQLDRFKDRLASDPVAGLTEFADDAARLRDAAGLLMNEEQAFLTAVQSSAERFAALEGAFAESRKPLTRDPVTGLPNRLALSARLKTLLESEGETEPVALIVASVEGLRGLAEQHGAATAEKALGKLSTLFRKSIKKSDFVARVGGQEFAFLCSDVTEENAQAIAQRIRQSVEALRVALPGRAFTAETLSLAAGIAVAQPMATPTDFMQQAELALSAARAGSRSGVLVYSAELGGRRTRTYSPHAA